MLSATLTSLLVPFWGLFTGSSSSIHHNGDLSTPNRVPPLQFELRHLHAVSSSAHVVFSDVPSSAFYSQSGAKGSPSHPYILQPRSIKTFRPPSYNAVTKAQQRSALFAESERLDWEEEDVIGPDVEKREVLLELAKMANNAYVDPSDEEWFELDSKWNNSHPYGWEPDADGFRGHVFATPDNSTIVVSIKGTSAAIFGGGGPTVKKDKINDNLLFSCCCARVGWSWTTVCGCYRGSQKCDQDCLERALIDDSVFYPIGTNLYNNITYIPEANIWLTGHSLGGALASLLGITFGAPVVAFESPGDRLAASRLHLPSPPSTQHVTHVYHTADPIAMGTCNGVLSSCALGGYALETACHLGKSIVYDTVTNLSWTVDFRRHGIANVIENILTDPWAPSVEIGREVPEAMAQVDCVECYSWEFGDFPEA